jgi:hypothetical protein
LKLRDLAFIDEELDAAGFPRDPSDQAAGLQFNHHSMDAWRADLKVLLEFSLGRGLLV